MAHGEIRKTVSRRSPRGSSPRDDRSAAGPVLPVAALLLIAGGLAYANSFRGALVMDDYRAIWLNPSIRSLWPITQVLSPPAQLPISGRPIVNLTLALNYAFGGLAPWGYHAFNLAVHLMAGLLLWGVLRRIWPAAVRRAAAREETTAAAGGDGRTAWLAAVSALIWLLHPLQTESVTYLVQRTESLMGLFYLLTLYCAIRGIQGTGRSVSAWFIAAVVACGMGMACKEVMVTAPVVVLLCDRVFLASSFREIASRRRGLYLGLAATWIILAMLMAGGPRSLSVGFSSRVGVIEYAKNQCIALITYLKLAFWPHPLTLDYGLPRALTVGQTAPYAVVLAALLLVTIVMLIYRPTLGFLGAWVFIILAPTSSFVPIATEVAAERRMYLPLAAVVVLAVGLGDRLLDRLALACSLRPSRLGLAKGLALVLVVGVLGGMTIRRNAEYHDAVGMWQGLLAKQPDSARLYVNLGLEYTMANRQEEALAPFQRAAQLAPRDMPTRANLGKTLATLGRYQEAVREYQTAMALGPADNLLRCSLGQALEATNQTDAALESYREVLKTEPENLMALSGMGACCQKKGDFSAAAEAFRKVLARAPKNSDVGWRLAACLLRAGNPDQAIAACRKNLAVDPKHAPTWRTLGNALAGAGRPQEALDAFQQALSIDPGNADARCNVGMLLGQLGQADAAVATHLETLRMFPRHAPTRFDLGRLLEQQGRLGEAAAAFQEVLRIEPGHAGARAALDRLRTQPGGSGP